MNPPKYLPSGWRLTFFPLLICRFLFPITITILTILHHQYVHLAFRAPFFNCPLLLYLFFLVIAAGYGGTPTFDPFLYRGPIGGRGLLLVVII